MQRRYLFGAICCGLGMAVSALAQTVEEPPQVQEMPLLEATEVIPVRVARPKAVFLGGGTTRFIHLGAVYNLGPQWALGGHLGALPASPWLLSGGAMGRYYLSEFANSPYLELGAALSSAPRGAVSLLLGLETRTREGFYFHLGVGGRMLVPFTGPGTAVAYGAGDFALILDSGLGYAF
jgi:hypothetical protein